MPKLGKTLKYYALLVIVYLFGVFFLPANKIAQKNYHLTSTTYHIVLFLVILPLIAIWFGAFYSYARMRQYSTTIAKTNEGDSFSTITKGLIVLAWGSILSSILSLFLNAIANSHAGFHPAAVIINNYLGLLVPLIGYSIISGGTRSLNALTKTVIGNRSAKAMIALFLLIGVAYCYITFRYLDLHSIGSTNNPYYLPVWLMILTVIIPSLYTWFIGLVSAFEMNLYAQKVSGVLYRRAMRLLSLGIGSIIISSIGVEYLHSIVPRTGHLSLNATLLIVNFIYLFLGAGYILLSLGARQLRAIEEV